MKIFQTLIMLVFLLTLVGCEDKSNYRYLMQHPLALQKEVIKCKSTLQPLVKNSYCHVVLDAAVNFTSILMEQQQDPQKFGQRIMNAQFVLGKARNEWIAVQSSIGKRQVEDNPSTKLDPIKLQNVKQNYQEKEEEVKVLLAVISLSRPG